MESPTPRYIRASLPVQSSSTHKQRRSGYEPSDTETDWLETPWNEPVKKIADVGSEGPKLGSSDPPKARKISPLRLSRRTTSAMFDQEVTSPVKTAIVSPVRRRHSKSPYKPRRDDAGAHLPTPGTELRRSVSPLSPRPGPHVHSVRRNISPFSKSEHRRHVSPYKPSRQNPDLGSDETNRKGNQGRTNDVTSGATETSNYSRRSLSAPRSRQRERNQLINSDHKEQKRSDRTYSPLPKNSFRKEREVALKNTPSVGEINEMVANAKIATGLPSNTHNLDSTDSISQGDIFFSRDYAAMTMQKIIFPKNGGFENIFSPKPKMFMEAPGSRQRNKGKDFSQNTLGNLNGSVSTRTTMTSSSAVSRQSSSLSEVSGRTSASTRKFIANRQKVQTEAWFSCIKKGSCRTSKTSPEKDRVFDEASFIEKAFVVENLRQFWADKHQPASLNGFTCHKQEAQLLKQLASHETCPHILLKGPPGAGKKALTLALLREIYGDAARNISHDLRYFQIQETRPMQVVVPVTSSAHHVELNVYLEPNAKYALMALVKQISSNYTISPEVSNANFKTDYTVMVLYDVDKAAESIQHLIKWIMDCYSDACKLVLCCEDDVDILEPVKNRCKAIKVDAPVTHEIMEVLIQIARKENFDLSMSFAAKIATKSKQNLRKAIMALEACKAHNYPFAEDQPISMGWEEVLVDLATDILADPSQKRLFFIRGKFQKLLVDFVHPKLILQKLVEQFLMVAETNLKRELYYWHAYYDKRLPLGTSALLKLEGNIDTQFYLILHSCTITYHS
ncbi:hypothetical protein RJ639_013002 [Escallonia herrerae]|uniref:Replication factor C subunit 3 n=1 Tax=Escallonia herrerae TaxID=1293975 RepID=A0AA89AS88_9ASTE|nr:hypothetical protein RJ639_013002 [Escallonia herrerae]